MLVSGCVDLATGRRRRRDVRKAATRERLFEAAIAEFSNVGFATAQVSKIARDAGVAHATFFFHFPTKEHVLLEMQLRGQRQIVARLAGKGRPRSVRAALERAVEAIVSQERIFGSDMLRALLAVHTLREVDVDQAPAPLVELLTNWLAEAADRGEIRKDLTPAELSMMFLTGLFGFLVQTPPKPQGRRRSMNRFVMVFLRGLDPG